MRVSAEDGAAPPVNAWIKDQAILAIGSTPLAAIPERIYTPEILDLLKTQPDLLKAGRFAAQSKAAAGKEWLGIPDDQWRAMLAPYAPVTIAAVIDVQRPPCPFCGEPFEGCVMTLPELREHPFQAKTKCCGATVYEREDDMPADYPVKPNHTEQIPHLDGSLFPYRFYCPPGTENAPVFIPPSMTDNSAFDEKDSKRRLWFCSAGEVWIARLRLFLGGGQDMLTSLGALAYQEDDAAALHTLAVIYDRLAEIYPGLPLYSHRPPQGFALGKDGKSYLTREEYLSESPEDLPPRQKAFWYRQQYNFDKLNYGLGAWHDGVTGQAGLLADVFDLIRDHDVVKAYSTERYGAPNEWEKRVMHNLLEEATRVVKSGGTGLGGNTVDTSIRGGLKLGLVMQDKELIADRLNIVRSFWNNWVSEDGICEEGSYVYGSMIHNFIGFNDLFKTMGLGDLAGERPLVERVKELGNPPKPLLTLYGMEDTHSDEYLYAFRSTYPWAFGPPNPLDYAAKEASLCYPFSGIACLRAGAAGSRMEAFMDFQTKVGHSHSARLNLQLFYEGMPLLPDFGYTNVSADPTEKPWRDLKYKYDLVPLPTDENGERLIDSWRSWYGYSHKTENHCVARIDGQQHRHGPCAFIAFHGSDSLEAPEAWASFVDVDATGMFQFGDETSFASPVTSFRRQVAAITLPDGRPVLLDWHHLKGGSRHDILWHAPADNVTIANAEAEPMESSISAHLGNEDNDDFWHAQAAKPFRWKTTPGMWLAQWTIRPEDFAPQTPETRDGVYAPWAKIFTDKTISIWGGASGDPASEELMSEQRPWPTHMKEGKNWETVVFKDAMNHLVYSRQGAPGFETTFFHVLEPRTPEQKPSVWDARILKATGPGSAAVLSCGSQDAPQRIWAGASTGGGTLQAADFVLQGQLGLISPTELRMLLFDGESVTHDKWALRTDASWKLTLTAVVGDLTGSPYESALIVQSTRPLPTDNTLVGRVLTVHHQTSPLHTSGYTISKVTAQPGDGVYRLDLANTPPFIRQRTRVAAYDPAQPLTINIEHLLRCSPTGDNNNRRVRFLKSGFDTTYTVKNLSGWHCREIELDERPPSDIQLNDYLITYTIQPGDTVRIPSLAAVKGTTDGTSVQLEVFATGALHIELPGGYTRASLKKATGELLPLPSSGADGTLRLSLTPSDLADGRASMVISK